MASFEEAVGPRDIAHPHHSPSAVEKAASKEINPFFNEPGWFNHPLNGQEKTHESPSSCEDLEYRGHAPSVRATRTTQRRPSLMNPRVDIEDGVPKVCACCHLRRRSTFEETTHSHLLHNIHTALDQCCEDFCPDTCLPQRGSSPDAHPQLRRSMLREQLQTLLTLSNDQPAPIQNNSSCANKPPGRTASPVNEASTCDEDDEIACWSPRDFD